MIAVARNLEEVRRALITIPGKFDAMNTVLERLCVATENLSAMPKVRHFFPVFFIDTKKSAGAMRVNGSSWVPRRGMGMCDCCFWTVLVLVVAFLFSGVLIVYAALTTSPDTRM